MKVLTELTKMFIALHWTSSEINFDEFLIYGSKTQIEQNFRGHYFNYHNA